MNQITYNNRTIFYVLKNSTKRRIYFRMRDGIVYVSAPKHLKEQELHQAFINNFDKLYQKCLETKTQNVIHVNGIAYTPKFFVGSKKDVKIVGNEIWITSCKNSYEEYKKILYEFYKKELIREIGKLLEEAKRDFKEIKFPKITVRYMKSMFGNYTKSTNVIKLSSILVKYDYKYIKHVLYHELSHALEMSHSDVFYKVFEEKYPEAKLTRKEFKKIKYYDYI